MKIELELGTEITGVFGATEPEMVGKIAGIDYIPNAGPNPECDVKWEDGSYTCMLLSDIREDYFDPKGSPIGYFATKSA